VQHFVYSATYVALWNLMNYDTKWYSDTMARFCRLLGLTTATMMNKFSMDGYKKLEKNDTVDCS